MEKLTYKEFEREMNKMGYSVGLDDDLWVYVQDEYVDIIVAVNKKIYKHLDLEWVRYKSLTNEEKELVADLCWQLASTPLADREEPKSYHLKVCPKYSPFFNSTHEYLNINVDNGRMMVSTNYKTRLSKTIFTEEEINELAKEYDLSLFEKVEVTDEELA